MGFERDSRRSPTTPTVREVFDDIQGTPREHGVKQETDSNFPARMATEDNKSKLWEGGPRKTAPMKKTLLHLSKYFPGVLHHVIQKTF
jgi:hypothetical protein